MVEPRTHSSVSFTDETELKPVETLEKPVNSLSPPATTDGKVNFVLGSSTDLTAIPDMAPEPEPKTVFEETEAERTLPWKRNTTNDIVPCLTNLVMTDDEKPLMSEAPSWVSNPSYHNLKESGSPYVSPQTTLTAPPEKTHTPSIFEIFDKDIQPLLDKKCGNTPSAPSDIPIPPPWDNREREYEPVASPVINQHGDKSTNLLHSAHSVFPPPHHVIIPCEFNRTPAIRKSLSLPGKASSPQSPKHWQPIELQEVSMYKKCPSEAEIIFDEVAHQQDVKLRVSEWLQNTDDSDPEEYDGIQVNFSNHECATNGFEIDSGEESDIEMTYL